MEVTLGPAVLDQYDRLSLYNSPYPAHDRGHAVDCYPGGEAAPSPVAGVVRDEVTVRAPPRPYADEADHLLLVDVDVGATPGLSVDAGGTDLVARVMHVDADVVPGDAVSVGDDLGELVFPGFFGPWVDPHLHVGFRRPDQHLRRATGSLPLVADVSVDAVPWDGTGEVVAVGETWALLDAPRHPAPGTGFVGIEATVGPHDAPPPALDGGFRHYDRGGLFGPGDGAAAAPGPVGFLGERVGVTDGRTVEWAEVTVLANGEPIHGLSLFLARDEGFGAKLVCPDRAFAVGDAVTVSVRPADGTTVTD